MIIPDITLKAVKGIKYDEILAWTVGLSTGATIRYRLGDFDRLLSLENSGLGIDIPKKSSKERLTFDNISIKSIQGIKYDSIVDWTMSSEGWTTIKYFVKGKERQIGIESEAIEIEFTDNV